MAFTVKPGYKAVERKKIVTKHELKKKILVRGKTQHMISFPTKHDNYMVSIISQGDSSNYFYIRLFYLSRFKVLIRSSKLYEQIPRKLNRLLHEQALKNKYGESLLHLPDLTPAELELTHFI